MSNVEPANPTPPKGRAVLWLLALGVPLLLLAAWWPSAKPKARPALPNPNGYDYFVKAGGAMAGVWTNLSHQTLTATELQAFLSANQTSLDLVREGLRHKSHTHVDYDATYIERMMTNLSNFRQSGRLLVGEGWLAELEAKPTKALDGYFDAMHLGQECSRGGVIIERLVGVGTEHHALAALRPLLPKLDVQDSRRVLERLERLDISHEAPAVTFAAEGDWVSKAAPPWERFMSTVHPTLRKAARDVRTSTAQKIDTLQAARRRAIIEAAARLFELEKGRRPTGYADLVPTYLPAAPLDPTTGKEIAHPF
jgi:hypothetical protein